MYDVFSLFFWCDERHVNGDRSAVSALGNVGAGRTREELCIIIEIL